MDPTHSLKGRSSLVVESEPVIALHIECILKDVGARVVRATTPETALGTVEDSFLSAAVVDFVLEHGTNSPICNRLNSRGIPYVLFSGAPKPNGPCADGAFLEKPTTPEKLLACVESLFEPAQIGKGHGDEPVMSYSFHA